MRFPGASGEGLEEADTLEGGDGGELPPVNLSESFARAGSWQSVDLDASPNTSELQSLVTELNDHLSAVKLCLEEERETNRGLLSSLRILEEAQSESEKELRNKQQEVREPVVAGILFLACQNCVQLSGGTFTMVEWRAAAMERHCQ